MKKAQFLVLTLCTLLPVSYHAQASTNQSSPSVEELLFLSAVRNNDIATTEIILKTHTRSIVNCVDAISGNTPLLIATQNNNLAMVLLLINAGSNLSKTNKMGETALMIAIKENFTEIEQALRKAISEQELAKLFAPETMLIVPAQGTTTLIAVDTPAVAPVASPDQNAIQQVTITTVEPVAAYPHEKPGFLKHLFNTMNPGE